VARLASPARRTPFQSNAMFSILKGATRLVVLGGLATVAVVGTSVLVAGRDRTAAMAHQVQDRITQVIDRNIDDPTALRAQLRKLEQEYPKRIAALAGDLGSLREHMRQLERERAISERVVELAEADLGRLQETVAAAATSLASARGRFDPEQASAAQAQSRLEQVRQTRFVYASRASDATRDLGYLAQQADRLEEALAQVETERAQFQAQLWQIERQVDTIARNERLIQMMDQRKKTLEQAGRYQAVSLDAVSGRLAELRTRQEATLQVLSNDQKRLGYEDQARFDVDALERARTEFDARANGASFATPSPTLAPRH
jgi:chromosome segregation ATPase